MNIDNFTENKTGKLVSIAGIPGLSHAFIPDPLPPNWDWPVSLWPLLVEARASLAKLDGIGKHLPDPQLLLRPLQNREALSSSRLEGTYTDPRQQLLFQIDPQYPISEADPINAYREVYNYGSALRLHSENRDSLPISLRLIRELHGILMDGVSGYDKQPGEFRKEQNQIGRPARFVPPPSNYLRECLDNLEKYLHKDSPFDPLVNAFIVHYQFEAIHPFRDGNGRVGRLLLAILIQEWCKLSGQWLYMSAFFDANRDEYLDRLLKVSRAGDWEGWIEFCLNGVILQASDAERRCELLLDLAKDFNERITEGSYRLNILVDNLFISPVVQVPLIADKFGVSYPTAKSDIEKLVRVGILEEMEDTNVKTYFSPEILETTFGEMGYPIQ